MKRDMKLWAQQLLEAPVKKPMPVLSFPAIQMMGVTVKELIMSSDLQAQGMKLVADRTDASTSVSLMDLSVEAECFGSTIRFSDDEVPVVIGSVVTDEEEAEALAVPEIGAGRTTIYIEAIEKAVRMIEDRPVFAGVIGPFSLAGRLMDVADAMVYCYDEPDMVHTVLGKATDFIIRYIEAYKKVGANGVVIAEPLAGLMSPSLAEEFSVAYMRKIVQAVQDDSFLVIYHNCGNYTIQQIDGILTIGAGMYHFGNAIDMAEMMKHIPAGILAGGNVDPAGQFRNGTVDSIKAETKEIMGKCCQYPNFVISSGCDIPPMSKWENIDAFFQAAAEFYRDAR